MAANEIQTADGLTTLYEFIRIEGNPDGIHEEVQVVQRPGVDGTGLWHAGRKAMPFTITTHVDAVSQTVAQTMLASYRLLIDSAVLYRLKFRGADWGQVGILDVKGITQRALANSSGGLNPPSLGLLVAQWKMVSV